LLFEQKLLVRRIVMHILGQNSFSYNKIEFKSKYQIVANICLPVSYYKYYEQINK